MTRILLVRHGESEWNAAGRWQGWADPPLTDLGRTQARVAARALRSVLPAGFDAVAASDLRRATETAAIMAEAMAVAPVHEETTLRERDVGEWTGLTRAEIDERWPDWRASVPAGRGIEAPGGERHATFLARILGAVQRLAEAHDGANVLAVSHGGVIRTIERHLGIEPDPIPNLAGRWLLAEDGKLQPGDRVVLVDPEETELTVPPPH